MQYPIYFNFSTLSVAENANRQQYPKNKDGVGGMYFKNVKDICDFLLEIKDEPCLIKIKEHLYNNFI